MIRSLPCPDRLRRLLLRIALPLLAVVPAAAQEAAPQLAATLTLSAAELQSGSALLAVEDSAGHALAVVGVRAGDSAVWTRESRETADVPGTVHWHFDAERRVLVLDLRALDPAALEDGLTVTLQPLNTRSDRFSMAVYRESGAAAAQRDLLQTIRFDAP